MIGNIKWKKTAARWFAGEESGQGLVEYALILLLILCVRQHFTDKL